MQKCCNVGDFDLMACDILMPMAHTKNTNKSIGFLSHLSDATISVVIFFSILFLVISLIGIQVKAILDFFVHSEELTNFELQSALLHYIAFLLIGVKAYNILIAYLNTRHIDLKFFIEMIIIACGVEVVFNAEFLVKHPGLIQTFAVLGTVTLAMYLYFYPRLKEIEHDAAKHGHIAPTPTVIEED